MNKQQQERKAQLDQIMLEYYYQKNNVDDTICFLGHMFHQYRRLWEDIDNTEGNK